MPQQVFQAMFVESALIVATTLCLAQPELLFGGRSPRARSLLRYGGAVLLSLTFCWSVYLGCLLTLHSYALGPA